jgi:O-succinylbenzoic acid--CoA ligase
MNGLWLQLNDKKYSFESLRADDFPEPLTGFERTTLQFCRDWLTGVKSFSLHTSGSTGISKEIVILRGQMEISAQQTIEVLKLRRGGTALVCLDPRYIAGKMMLVRSFVNAMNIVAVEPTADPLKNISPGLKIDFTAVVPYQLQAILTSEISRKKFNDFKAVLIGGAEVDGKLKAQLDRVKPVVFATYGMTETISHIALQRLTSPALDYFTVMPGVAIRRDDRGCLVVHAAYLGKDEITTNDLVDVLSPHDFRWLGRWDNLINTGGIKVIPEKIEKEIEEILEHDRITNRFFVAGLPDDQLGNKITLILEGNYPVDQHAYLLKKLRSKMARYEVPREIKNVPIFVETATQKINRPATLKLL